MTIRAFDKRPFGALFLIVSTALILRCIFLGQQSLWLDECACECAKRGFWAAMRCDINNPPLYLSLLHYWMNFFGTSEAAIRALSVPPSVASVLLVYLLSTRLFSRPIGYLAAGYQTISAFQISFAQEARNYAWLEFSLLLAGLFLWNALGADSRRRRLQYWAAYTASITLALYTHYFAAFFIAGHGLYVLFRCRKQLLPAAISVATALILIAPFFIISIRALQAVHQIRRHPLLKFPQTYFTFLFGNSLIPEDDLAVEHVLQTLRDNAWIALLALASLAILGRFCWLAWRKWREPVLYVVFQATVPVTLAFLISLKKTFFDRRYMIPASPYLYILVAAAVWEVVLSYRNHASPRWKTWAGLAATGAYCLLLMLSLYQYYFVERFGKEQWREAIAYIESSSSPDGKDLLVFDPYYLQGCYHYYQKRDLPVWGLTPQTEREAVNSEALVRNRVRGFHRVWLVYSHNSNRDLLTTLKRLYPEQGAREFPLASRIEVYSFNVAGAQ